MIQQNITQIYLLAAILSATGEKPACMASNMQGLLNVLDIAREEKLQKVYWPSSIADGPSSPKSLPTANDHRTYYVWNANMLENLVQLFLSALVS